MFALLLSLCSFFIALSLFFSIYSSRYHFFALFFLPIFAFFALFFLALLLFSTLFSSHFCFFMLFFLQVITFFALFFLRAHFCFALMSANRKKSAWRSPLVATEPDRIGISSGIYRNTATLCCDDVTSIHRPSAAKKLFSSRSLFLWTTKALPSPLYTILTLRLVLSVYTVH